MPRTRKMTHWTVITPQGVAYVLSKTYRGACFKAFKKLEIDVPEYSTQEEYHHSNLHGIQHSHAFKDVFCFASKKK